MVLESIASKCACKHIKYIMGKHYFSAKEKQIPLNQFGIDQYDVDEVLKNTKVDLHIPQMIELSGYFSPVMTANQFSEKFGQMYKELYNNLLLLRELPTPNSEDDVDDSKE